MSKHKRMWNKQVYKSFLDSGRGCGVGADYLPWIRIQDFASQGVVSRVKGRTTGRVHHLMSNNELAYFYILDWSSEVIDIREQFPLLDLELAVRCAEQAGIKYPIDKVSGFPYVLTCDFMITTQSGTRARTIKMSAELSKPRILEKLEIERRYWSTLGVDWKIVTENEIPFNKAKNIEWLYSGFEINAQHIYNPKIDCAKELLTNMLLVEGSSIVDATSTVERTYELASGYGLSLFKNMVANRLISINLSGKISLTAKGMVSA